MTQLPARRSPAAGATAAPGEALAWRTSSYSGNGDNCVEVAPAAPGVLLRDTKDHGRGPVIAFTAEQWATFLAGTRSGSPGASGAVTVTPTADGGRELAAEDVRLRFTPSEWAAFHQGVLDGEFTDLAAVSAG